MSEYTNSSENGGDLDNPRVQRELRQFYRAKAGLRAHWISFIAVNGFLFLINMLVGYYYPWHLFPLLSWGIGMGIHSAVVYIKYHYPRLIDRGFFIHFAVFLIVNGFFLAINLITSPWYLWFYWPMFAWAVGLGEHFVAYNAKRRKLEGKPISQFYILWYPGVVCIFLAAVDLLSGGGFGWFLWPTVPIMAGSYAILQNQENLATYRHNRRANLPLVHSNQSEPISPPMKTSAYSSQSNRKYCPKCGEVVGAGHPFCEYCGQKLG
ncbi:MAG: 2TM domain-containing protein [Promethearchaeota archaeon]